MFQENGFLICITLTLLLAGVIMYYVNGRFRTIETSIKKQNTILSDFITNVRNDLGDNMGNTIVSDDNTSNEILISGPPSKDATLEAKISAENYLNQKIEVSDNDSETDDDSDSETDSDSDIESDDNQINIVKEENVENVKVIDISNDTANEETLTLPELKPIDVMNQPQKIIESSDLNNLSSDLKAVKLNDTISLDDISSSVTDIVDQVVGEKEQVDVDVNNDVNDNNDVNVTEESDTDLLSNIPYKKMKVDDLKKIALDNNLSTPNEINKLRKVELVSLIENNKEKIN